MSLRAKKRSFRSCRSPWMLKKVGKRQNLRTVWKRKTDLKGQTPIINQLYLGCTRREAKVTPPSPKQEFFRGLTTTGATEEKCLMKKSDSSMKIKQTPRSCPTQNHAHGHDERNTHFPRSSERRSYALPNAAEENAAYFGAIKTGYSVYVRRDSAEDSGTEWRKHVSQFSKDVCFCSLKQTTPSRQVIHDK